MIIVIQFTTLDGVVEDPDGSGRTAFGGWAMRHGPQGVAGDKFQLGPVLDRGTLLFGRRTWQLFAGLWPRRDDPFARRMNAAAKVVATRSGVDPGAWAHSRVLEDPLPEWAASARTRSDVVVIGSTSVVDALVGADLVDEYRLLVFPTATGRGRRLFPGPRHLRLVRSEQVGPAALCVLRPETGDPVSGGDAS